MKKHLSKILALTLFVSVISLSAGAQIFVKIRPPEPFRHERPMAPSPRHVWIDGEYVYHGDHYDYVEGYWTLPRPHQIWISGHWQNRRDGYQAWIPGHWRRG